MRRDYKITLDKDSITYPEEVMVLRLIKEFMTSNNIDEYNLCDNMMDFSCVWIKEGEIHYDLTDMAIAYHSYNASNLVLLACIYQAITDTFNEIEG